MSIPLGQHGQQCIKPRGCSSVTQARKGCTRISAVYVM